MTKTSNKHYPREGLKIVSPGSNRPVLEQITFTIQKGRTVGIVGQSGSGKSTLVDVLIGLLPPSNGTVRIDGKPLDGNLLPSWMHCLGYVPQGSYIYDGTLAENVAFGLRGSEIDRDHVLHCCHMAFMDD